MNGLSLLLLLAVVVGALGIGLKILKGLDGEPKAGAAIGRYTVRPSILSAAERSFAGVLDHAMPKGVTWFAKVRVGDIVVTKKGLSPAQRASAWNRVNQKHVDFLLVRASDLAPVLAIELDDKSHEEESRKTRDAFVDEVFRSCNLPLLHVAAKSGYNPTELAQQISARLSAS